MNRASRLSRRNDAPFVIVNIYRGDFKKGCFERGKYAAEVPRPLLGRVLIHKCLSRRFPRLFAAGSSQGVCKCRGRTEIAYLFRSRVYTILSPSVFDAKAVWFLHALAGNALLVAKVANKWHALAANKGDLVWFGRKEERKRLRLAYESQYSEFVSVYGRRRIGKTFWGWRFPIRPDYATVAKHPMWRRSGWSLRNCAVGRNGRSLSSNALRRHGARRMSRHLASRRRKRWTSCIRPIRGNVTVRRSKLHLGGILPLMVETPLQKRHIL